VTGRAALVTGGGSGIGAAVAEGLAAAGISVCVTGRRPQPLREVADRIGGLAVVADTADEAQMDAAVQEVRRTYGTLDVLVCAAGVDMVGAVDQVTTEEWRTSIDINLSGAFYACRAALPSLVQAKGCIVTVASEGGLRATPQLASYAAAKAGVIMLTKSIAVDYGPAGVRANCVCPGWIRTPMADASMEDLAAHIGGTSEEAYALATAHAPLRRPGAATEAAAAVVWLASGHASYITGAVLSVDGGSEVVDAGSAAFEAFGAPELPARP
jgi:meso-butanediol dehydrogenase / (S,S)-butanediol dehydrogenase / diacetyl reductase